MVKQKYSSLRHYVTTSLDQEQVPYKAFKSLYAKRWGVEEDYKRQKSRLEIENFSGLTVHAIYQDIYAKLFVKNCALAMINESQPEVDVRYQHRKHRYQINVAHTLSKMKHFCIRLLTASDPIMKVRQFMAILTVTIEPVREGRQYPRRFSKTTGRRFNCQYKRAR